MLLFLLLIDANPYTKRPFRSRVCSPFPWVIESVRDRRKREREKKAKMQDGKIAVICDGTYPCRFALRVVLKTTSGCYRRCPKQFGRLAEQCERATGFQSVDVPACVYVVVRCSGLKLKSCLTGTEKLNGTRRQLCYSKEKCVFET